MGHVPGAWRHAGTLHYGTGDGMTQPGPPFEIICDETNNSLEDIKRGVINVTVRLPLFKEPEAAKEEREDGN